MSAPTDKSAKIESPFPAAASLVGVYGEQLFRILEQACSGFVLLDAQNRAQRWNEGYLLLFPWLTQGLKVGSSLHTVLQAACVTERYNSVAAAHLGILSRQLTCAQATLPNGREVLLATHTISASYSLLTCKEVVSDASHLTFFDALTHLPNRRLLLDRLSQAMLQSERTGWRGALLTIDMGAGEALQQADASACASHLQQEVAQRLLSCMRVCDSVARLDAEHFVIMISDLSPDSELASLLVERLGERLQESLNAGYTISGRFFKLQANIGATLFGPHSRSASELLNQAEIAMYRLRDEESRGLHFFRPKQLMAAPDRSLLEQELREALRLNQFEMQFQPQYSVHGTATGLEALLRWRHPKRGLVPPRIFLSVAEDSDIIVSLGLWIIRTTCEQMARWKSDAQLSHLPISVNISLRQLQQPDFAAQLESILSQTGIAPASLILEISSCSLQPLGADIAAMLSRLSRMGIRLSLDDFDNEASNQDVLTRLPLSQVKLSQTLVQRLGPNNASDAAAQAAMALARQAQVLLVASGVETLEQRALLAQHGCRHFMGYLFSAPVPVHQLKSLLRMPQVGQLQQVA
ncbi:MAG: bifunctional diguanylate cyclase/phosphodiesterase [Comamonas sp.]|jgi:diguanylate cyclase (GGDEF)-like protein|nr:bifunctional diguanylate cyclase/phosphodiesterase [Comamonas sp.]